MEEERGNINGPIKITEPVITVPSPRALLQSAAQVAVSSVPGQSKRCNKAMEIFFTLDTFDTDLSADSIEWCPIEPFRDLLVCGTYQLSSEESDNTDGTSGSRRRLGRIYLFRVADGGKLKLLQRLEVAAVLDMKWAHVRLHGKILLGIVNSIGYLHIYELTGNENPTLISIAKAGVNCDQKEVLALSLDWSTGSWRNDTDRNVKIVVSDSKGSISVFKLYGEELKKDSSWKAHEFEAWIAAFDCWNSNVVYTGGDDCKFQHFDLRIGSQPVTAVNRVHSAGVTSLHSNSNSEFLLASGSYDQILRLWDTRHSQQPLSITDLGGGIWRLKWDPFTYRYLLAACMYEGFGIVDCKCKEVPTIVRSYMEHDSISYGCDWSLLTSQEILQKKIFEKQAGNIVLTGTCSFYDHTLKVSAVCLDND